MKICIVGAGNIGLALASTISLTKQHDVVIYSKRKFDISKLIFKDAERKEEFHNLNIRVESDVQEALKGTEYILCTYPAFLRKQFIETSSKFIEPGAKLGFIPGYGGAEYICKDLVKKGVVIFGLQRVPFVARQENKEISMVLSRKTNLYIAAIPKKYTEQICEDMYQFIDIPSIALDEYLAVTLAPSNPLLHLSGIYQVFKDYQDGDYYDKQLMFYTEWNDETSKILLDYDKELQEICHRMKPLDLKEVVSLGIYYESPTVSEMTKKLKSIKSFEVVTVPLIKKEDKYYPDFQSRMFIEDFPYGIAIIKYFGILTNVDTPTIDKILEFYKEKTGICYFNEDGTFGKDIEQSGIPYNYGLKTLDEIIHFYMQ